MAPDREYCYEVSAVGASGEETTPGNNEVCGTTEELEAAMPEPPVNVAAEALSSSMISVTWDAPDDAGGITGYVVYQHSGPRRLCNRLGRFGDPRGRSRWSATGFRVLFSASGRSLPPGPPMVSSRVCATNVERERCHRYVNLGQRAERSGQSSVWAGRTGRDISCLLAGHERICW